MVILPLANESDFHDLPETIKADLEIIFVSEYEQIFKTVFE